MTTIRLLYTHPGMFVTREGEVYLIWQPEPPLCPRCHTPKRAHNPECPLDWSPLTPEETARAIDLARKYGLE